MTTETSIQNGGAWGQEDQKSRANRLTGLQALRAPFPPEKISQKPKGGAMLSYVGHADITERLLDIDPEWNWQPCRWHDGVPEFERSKDGKPIGLWIRLTVCGVTRLGYGSVEPNAFDSEKQLIGDALRNAAMRFGVALDLWSKSERSSPQMDRQSFSGPAPATYRAPAPVVREVNPDEWGTQPSDQSGVLDEPKEMVQMESIYGVQITIGYDEHRAMQTVLPFGKYKGSNLAQITGMPEGSGYLKWMINNIRKNLAEGKQITPVEQNILVAAHASGVVA
jgi:uncharacterized protein (DUF3820 family)